MEGRARRRAAANALEALWQIDIEDSDDGDCSGSNDENDGGNELVTQVSDTEAAISDQESIDTSDVENDSNTTSDNEHLSFASATSGWRRLETGSNNVIGRTRIRNKFSQKSGISNTVKGRITSELEAFECFIDVKKVIFECTRQFGVTHSIPDNFTIEDLERFIAIAIGREIYGKNHSRDLLWSKTFGIPVFRRIMSRNKYEKIKRSLRFDQKSNRSMRATNDPFTHIREVFELIKESCQKSFTPGFSVCIDEQLVPLKSRCKFSVFMPNKPDKFGFKFWLLADNDTKYIFNILAYLGASEKDECQDQKLADFVVKKLIDPLTGKAYNITCDNFFTSIDLARSLLKSKPTIVGTLRANSKGLPETCKSIPLSERDTAFFYNDADDVLSLKYRTKKNKSVLLLSTMHANPLCDDSNKRKPFPILFYNHNKVGVDAADAMLRLYTTRCASIDEMACVRVA